MSPQEKLEFETMKATVKALHEVMDVAFIENLKRRAVLPNIPSGDILFDSDSSTSGVLQAVDEAGSATYNVAKAYDDGKIITIDGTNYKIGVYSA